MHSKRPPSKTPPFQWSLGFLMLVMLVFGLISASLLYASRVPVVQQEWSTLIGSDLRSTRDPSAEASSNEADAGMTRHLLFIMFTFASPLLLAVTLSSVVGVVKIFGRRGTPVRRRFVEDSLASDR